MRAAILRTLSAHPDEAWEEKELGKLLGYRRRDIAEFRKTLQQLLEDREIVRVGKRQISLPQKSALARGVLRLTQHGYGFVDRVKEPSVFINAREASQASDGDWVQVEMRDRGHEAGPEGRIVEVDPTKRLPLLGRVYQQEGRWFAEVKTGPLGFTARLQTNARTPALSGGDWVLLKAPASRQRFPIPVCQIHKILGNPGKKGLAEKGLLTSFGFSEDYPQKAIKASLMLKPDSSKRQLRRDWSGDYVITIDPADAKDHDDAVSLTRGKNGDYHLGVHIADVSRYVLRGGAIDEEARRRAFSVYLQHHHLPMLPPRLPGELCSLKPGGKRLALTVLLHFDRQGQVKSREIFPSRIRIKQLLSYEQAQEHIESSTRKPSTSRQKAELTTQLKTMWELARKLKANRLVEGGVDFDLPEMAYAWEDGAAPVSVFREARLESHQLIEEFMLAANRAVAEIWGEKFSGQAANVFRVHPPLEADRRQRLADYLHDTGFDWPADQLSSSRQIADLLDEAHRRFPLEVTAAVARKALTLARYDAQPLGHFGLGFKHYLHFTSPIRRYADLTVHRLVWDYLIQNQPLKNKEEFTTEIEGLCLHLSQRERAIAELERESSKIAGLLYLNERRGETFPARLVEVYQDRLYVSLQDLYLEGVLTPDSPVHYRPRKQRDAKASKPRQSRLTLSIGDSLEVRIHRLDLLNRKLELRAV